MKTFCWVVSKNTCHTGKGQLQSREANIQFKLPTLCLYKKQMRKAFLQIQQTTKNDVINHR